jgi:hypothetical protein
MILTGVLSELAQKYTLLEQRALASPLAIRFTVAPFGGVRTQADTTKILTYRDNDYAVYVRAFLKAHPGRTPMPKNDWRKIAPFGSSYHNYGAAFDVEITEVQGMDVHVTDRDGTGPAPIWHADSKYAQSLVDQSIVRLAHMGIAIGLARVTGDPPHFQLPYSLTEVRAKWLATGKAVGGQSPVVIIGVLAILGLIALGILKGTTR